MNLEIQKYIEKLRNQGFTDDEIVEYMSLKAMQKEYQDAKEQEVKKNSLSRIGSIFNCAGGATLILSCLLFDNNADARLLGNFAAVTCWAGALLVNILHSEKLLECHHESPYDHQIAVFEESKHMNQTDKVKTR